MTELTSRMALTLYTIKHFIRKVNRRIKRKLGIHSHPTKKRYGWPLLDCNSAHALISNMITSGMPFMAGRLGGIEGMVTVEAIQVEKGWKKQIKGELQKKAQINAGFFPPTVDNLVKFSNLMQESIQQVDLLGSMSINNEEYLIKRLLSRNAVLTSIRNLEPYYSDQPWTSALSGKKVLVIHPFVDTIKKQYKKRELLFQDANILPEFELVTIKAIQSIAGTKTKFNDWFEALEYMYDEAMKIDFDIAIIGCGAYGFPLAAKIKQAGKQAIHLGGATQILFGIKGNRWENIPEVKKLFNEYWVRPSLDEIPKNAKEVEGGCYW